MSWKAHPRIHRVPERTSAASSLVKNVNTPAVLSVLLYNLSKTIFLIKFEIHTITLIKSLKSVTPLDIERINKVAAGRHHHSTNSPIKFSSTALDPSQ